MASIRTLKKIVFGFIIANYQEYVEIHAEHEEDLNQSYHMQFRQQGTLQRS